MGSHVMVFDVTNLGVVLVPYQPNSEEIRNTDAASKQASKQAPIAHYHLHNHYELLPVGAAVTLA